jgi:FMN-dependent NADH-azoreductase
MNILFINSSPRGNESYSQQVAQRLVDGLKTRHPEAGVVIRDVAKQPLPHIGEDFISAIAVMPEQRNAGQSAAIALSDVLIEELIAADTVVIAAPMYNFGLPSTLKAWIDHIVRAQRTFAYTKEAGPHGLLQGKQAILVVARGGVYSDGPAKPMDFQESYLRATLGFVGITDVRVVRVEGVARGESAAQAAIAAAQEQSDLVLSQVA